MTPKWPFRPLCGHLAPYGPEMAHFGHFCGQNVPNGHFPLEIVMRHIQALSGFGRFRPKQAILGPKRAQKGPFWGVLGPFRPQNHVLPSMVARPDPATLGGRSLSFCVATIGNGAFCAISGTHMEVRRQKAH